MKKVFLGLLVLPMVFAASVASAEVGGIITRTVDTTAVASQYDATVTALVVGVLQMFEWSNEEGSISFTDTNYSVNYGCNTIFGSYEMNKLAVDIGESASTMMACQDDLMAADRQVIETLGQVETLTFTDGQLVLAGAESELRFTPSFALVGGK